ncbi:MAG TPA: hypothetical protein VFP44_22890 [Usitatibacter sp.]|nr:hypothetical protein [Usitatibacter sp.]
MLALRQLAAFVMFSSLVLVAEPASASQYESVSSGPYMTPPVYLTYEGSDIGIAVNSLGRAGAAGGHADLIRFEVWAANTAPARGASFTGHFLGATDPETGPILGAIEMLVRRTLRGFTAPPDGTYTMVLVLKERTGACNSPDGFCTADSLNVDRPRTWIGGVPQPVSAGSVLENPTPGSFQSGIGLISGWACRGPVSVSVDGALIAIPHGGERADTTSGCDGNSRTGFGLLVNFNNFGQGTHTAQLFVNGAAAGNPVPFSVMIPSGEFMTGLSKTVAVPAFPSEGRMTTLVWQESQQNFAIKSVVPSSPPSHEPGLAGTPKSPASGIFMSPSFAMSFNGPDVTVSVFSIWNVAIPRRDTGDLRLDLWAATSVPERAGTVQGYRLGSSPSLGSVPAGSIRNGAAETIRGYSAPPDGTYTMVLALMEQDSANCAAADKYCIADTLNAAQPLQWVAGSPRPLAVDTFAFENPQPGSYQSGIGIISGWSCLGPVDVLVDNRIFRIPHGGPRADASPVCGHANSGFGLLINYNNFGSGTHTAQLYVNGGPRGRPIAFTVSVPSGEFMTGLSRNVPVSDFPSAGRTTTLVWQQSQQNFAIQSVSP